MLRNSILILTTTFAAGLLFVNVYNSMIDAVSWGSNIPTSIQTTRDYYKSINPGNFFRIISPINQLLSLLALVIFWKGNKRIRIYCALALVIAIFNDAFTFTYFYPRNEILFKSPIDNNLVEIKTAWSQWSTMNWFRSGSVLLNLIFNFAAMTLHFKNEQ